jgi:hypothetical protein
VLDWATGIARTAGVVRKDFRGYSEFFLKLSRAIAINDLDDFFRISACGHRRVGLPEVMVEAGTQSRPARCRAQAKTPYWYRNA